MCKDDTLNLLRNSTYCFSCELDANVCSYYWLNSFLNQQCDIPNIQSKTIRYHSADICMQCHSLPVSFLFNTDELISAYLQIKIDYDNDECFCHENMVSLRVISQIKTWLWGVLVLSIVLQHIPLDLSHFQLTCMPIKSIGFSALLKWLLCKFCNLQGATIDILKLCSCLYLQLLSDLETLWLFVVLSGHYSFGPMDF